MQERIILCVGTSQCQPRWGGHNIVNTHSSSSSSSTASDVPFVLFACVSSVSLDTLEDLKRVKVTTSAEEGNERTMKDLACILLDDDDFDDFHAKSENTTTSGLSPNVLAITMRAMRSKDEFFAYNMNLKVQQAHLQMTPPPQWMNGICAHLLLAHCSQSQSILLQNQNNRPGLTGRFQTSQA